MRLIYERGQRMRPDPAGLYVYLWAHDGVARYVGKGVNDRWFAHAKPRRSDANQRKYRYFRDHLSEMVCSIIAEALIEVEQVKLEDAKIAEYGFLADGTGTLLNDRRASPVPSERVRHETPWSHKPLDIRLWRRLMEEGPFAPNAILYRVIALNPKKEGSPGRENFAIYPPPGEATTIAKHYAKVRADGFEDSNQLGHLAWDYVHGFIGVMLPEGETVPPGHVLPSGELLRQWALELGTENEWRRLCASCERKGGKLGG